MKVLVACEESQAVCIAFRNKGHEAYSCDLQECSGGHPEWHIKDDVFNVIKNNDFDLLIGHPPCTYLSTVGNAFFNIEKYGNKAIERWRKRIDGLQFFYDLWNCGIDKICLENHQGFLGTNFRKADQIIHPYYFGDVEMKRTHLWLKNLTKLQHFKVDDLFDVGTHSEVPKPKWTRTLKNGKIKNVHWCETLINDAKSRSKTFPGIAEAMANQWG